MYFKEYYQLVERSYSESDIPSRVFLAINFDVGYDEEDKRLENTIKSLLDGKLVGVKGVGGTDSIKEMIIDWGNMRSLLIIMNSSDFLKINKASRVMYDNADYLVSNGMYALRRLYNELDDNYSSIFTKMQNYIAGSIKDEDRRLAETIVYNGIFSTYFQIWIQEKNNTKKVNTIKDLVKFFRICMNETKEIPEYIKKISDKKWYSIFENGIKLMGKTYSDEKEWIIKDNILNIPDGSRFIAVEPSYSKSHWEKLHSDDKMKQWGAEEHQSKQYEKWLRAIEELRKKWDVKIVSENYVDSIKKSLINKRYFK